MLGDYCDDFEHYLEPPWFKRCASLARNWMIGLGSATSRPLGVTFCASSARARAG